MIWNDMKELYNFTMKNWKSFNFEILKYYIIGFAFGTISSYITNMKYYLFELFFLGLLFSVLILSIKTYSQFLQYQLEKNKNMTNPDRQEEQLINILSTLLKPPDANKDKHIEDGIDFASPNIKKYMPEEEHNNGRKNDDRPSDQE